MKVGILGAGHMAGIFVDTLRKLPEVEVYAVAARELDRAKAFASRYEIPNAFGSYVEMLQLPELELVYIATPHSHHYAHMKLCIAAGKAVLCEKAFTQTLAQAREIMKLAREKGVFVAEAIWTRYMPYRKMLDALLLENRIGKPYALTANLSYAISQKERIVEPGLAGGALLDLGVYCLNFAIMHFGKEIERLTSTVQWHPTGVDGQESITLCYKDGRMASLYAGIYGRSDRRGCIYGDQGYLVVDNINNPQQITQYDLQDQVVEVFSVPKQISGYEYEMQECVRLLQEGKLESTSMPLEETLYCMELMEKVQAAWT